MSTDSTAAKTHRCNRQMHLDGTPCHCSSADTLCPQYPNVDHCSAIVPTDPQKPWYCTVHLAELAAYNARRTDVVVSRVPMVSDVLRVMADRGVAQDEAVDIATSALQ